MGPRSDDRGNELRIAKLDGEVVASMGPRSDDRGNGMGPIEGTDVRQASMGPRSDDRGNHERRRIQCDRGKASMGPRSDDRGNERRNAVPGSLVGLQWGRDRMIAEMTCKTEHRFGSGWLQWGRDRMIAEIWLRCNPRVIPVAVASMGPRSDDRGNDRVKAGIRRKSLLQWGRDRMIAEIADRFAGSEGVVASMGPRSDDRGNVVAPLVVKTIPWCFNGAAIG